MKPSTTGTLLALAASASSCACRAVGAGGFSMKTGRPARDRGETDLVVQPRSDRHPDRVEIARAPGATRQSAVRSASATPKRRPAVARRSGATSHRAWSTTSWRVSWGSSISEACVPQPIQPMRSEVMMLSPGRGQAVARAKASVAAR